MRRLPGFHRLRAFEAAARLGSFAGAADELHLTPSAISHQVRALEGELGRALFERHGRRVEATAAAERLLGRLSAALDEMEAACAELRGGARGLGVHCVPSFASEWLGPRLAGFMGAHPEVALKLSASAEPVDLLRREEFDLSIAYGAAPRRAGLVAEPLGTEQVAAMARPDLALLPIGRLVLIDSVVSPVTWTDWFAVNGLPMPPDGPRPAFDRAALAIAAAVQGVGAVLESTRLAEAALASGRLAILPGTRPIERPMHFLCYRAGQRGRAPAAAFRRWLLHEIGLTP